jgi:hypothetical protein
MITDLDSPTFSTPFLAAHRGAAPVTQVVRTRTQSSYRRLSRAQHEAQFEREHGSLWTPGLLDRLSLPLTRFHE